MATISEDYVSFKIAKLLKEKGFDEECLMVYIDGELFNYHDSDFPSEYELENDGSGVIDAPTLQMAMKWLRETHDIDFDINTTGSRHVRRYHLAIWENKDEEMVTINPIGYFNKWEQACEAAIKYCLENLI